MQRLSKEELHDDAFMDGLYRFINYAEQNYPKLLAGLGVVVVAALIGYFIQDSATKREQAAIGAIGDVQVALMQGNTSSAITRAQAIARDYSGDPVASRALITLANIYYDQGRYEEAITHYRKFIDAARSTSDPQVYGATAGIAAAMSSQGNVIGAAQQYVAYADQNSQTPFAPLALIEAAAAYKASGNVDQAVATYKRVQADHPKSPAARTAETELAILGHLPN